TFGFFNQFQYLSFLLLDQIVDPVSPEESNLPLISSFATGTIVSRDSWNNPDTILGIQGGYDKLNVTSHRHEDQNSFILVHQKERFFIDPGDKVYKGQVIGEQNREGDLEVNITKAKKLSNVRASGSDDAAKIAPKVEFSLEEAMEYIKDDEYLEVTPKSIRMRKIGI
ncbi:MAG: hypothetical protein ACOCWA_07285, partial [Bacteroidota bacterium]